MCVFVYDVDQKTEPAAKRRPMTFTEVYLGPVEINDFRKNPRGELGTRTATLDAEGIRKLRAKLYLLISAHLSRVLECLANHWKERDPTARLMPA